MTLATRIVSETASQMGLVPLVWVAFRHWSGHKQAAAWWWIAVAYAVSWLADLLAWWVNPVPLSILYPISQATLLIAVFRSKDDAALLLAVFAALAGLVLATGGDHQPDILFRSVAWGSVVVTVWGLWPLGLLRVALLVSYGGGLLAWAYYVGVPGWASWLVYQAVRLGGMLVFCRAASQRFPRMTVIRSSARYA